MWCKLKQAVQLLESVLKKKQHSFLLLFSSCQLECGCNSWCWSNHLRGNLENQTTNRGAMREKKPGFLALLYHTSPVPLNANVFERKKEILSCLF